MRTLILGLDAFAPHIFERLSAEGRLPHLTRYAEAGGYARFEVANPPQSEVSWTSIATGLNPGAHGIFDFVHRDPATYTPYVSLLTTQTSAVGTQFTPPHTARTLFEEAADQGFPATSLWWPATFPARPEIPVNTLPGLGTPDILGRFGVGTRLTADPAGTPTGRKTPIEALQARGADCYTGALKGPARQAGVHAEVAVRLEFTGAETAQLTIGETRQTLRLGIWSPILEVTFKLGLFIKIKALTRVILTRRDPAQLYVMPLQIHPLHTPWRYATSRRFVKQVWRDTGPFLTLGMPQDTTALEDHCIDDVQFLALCEDIVTTRERILAHQLHRFQEGVLASVFDSLDRIQHMYWAARPDLVEAWYVKLDALVGRITDHLIRQGREQTKVVIVSDHGIAEFRHKVHLNRWLIERGYLVPQGEGAAGDLKVVDWRHSRAYAVGLNSLYVNLAGREGQGAVPPENRAALLEQLRAELLAWEGPAGPIAPAVWLREEAFEGPLAEYGPDLVIGYAPGYRASAETGLGAWEAESLVANLDHWGADHCMDYRTVPGVLFSNQDLSAFPHPSYRDFPQLTIGRTPAQTLPRPPQGLSEDASAVEARLKSLGYL